MIDNVKEYQTNIWLLKNGSTKQFFFVEEIEKIELKSKKHKRVCTILIYIEQYLILVFAATGHSNSSFTCLIGTPTGSTNSAAGLRIWTNNCAN